MANITPEADRIEEGTGRAEALAKALAKLRTDLEVSASRAGGTRTSAGRKLTEHLKTLDTLKRDADDIASILEEGW